MEMKAKMNRLVPPRRGISAGGTGRRILRRLFFPDYLFNRQVKTTPAGRVFLGLIAAIGLAAFNTGNNLLFLMLAMMLAALLLSFIFSEQIIGRAWVSRKAPGIVTAGESFRVRYSVRNRNRWFPLIALAVEERLGKVELSATAPYIARGGEAEIKAAAVADRRGRVKFHELKLSTRAPFGWFWKKKKAPLAGEIVVLPAAAPAAPGIPRLLADGLERPQNRPGRGEDLFGFRQYRPGDPVKDIHWKTSARTGELMLREREKEEERRLRLVLGIAGTGPSEPDPHREELVAKAAHLAAAGINEGWQVRVEAGDRGVDFGAGPLHLFRIQYFLALFDDPEKPVGDTLPPTEVTAMELK